ncbi:MAG: acyltransferase domain-containing protein [Bacilli bacterium]|nr:acyltransferase domain-containing protein [Bacilli bacterium]
MYLNKILKDLGFNNECSKEVIATYKKLTPSEINSILKLYKDENIDFRKLITTWQKLLKKRHIEYYIGDLMFCLLLCEKLEALYKKHHLPHKLFIETMTDLRYKAVECKLVKKKWGLFVTPWYRTFFRLKLFSLGRLQFEIYTFMMDYHDKHVTLKKGQPCLNVHIPRNGERLDIKEVKKSIARAKKFFKPYFKDYILFSCDSWFMHKKAIEFAGKDSNIYRFAQLFNIIANIEIPHQEEEMWRLFDADTTDLTKLKADTSLRKKYLSYLKKGGKAGFGVGYFIYRF